MKINRPLRKFYQRARPPRLAATVGWADGTVVSSTRPNYIRCMWVDGTQFEALNDGAPIEANSPVDIIEETEYPGLLKAIAPRLAYGSTDFPYAIMKPHAVTHQWPSQDTVYIDIRQWLRFHPTASGMSIIIAPGWFRTPTGVVYYAGETVDLTTSRPSTGARFSLISLDTTPAAVVTDGTVKTTFFDLTDADIPDLPAGYTPICYVRLFSSQIQIRDNGTTLTDLIDVRLTSIGADAGSAIWGNITGTVDDQTDITDYTFDYIKFDTTFAAGVVEGRLQWNSEDGALEVGLPGGNVNLQIGQEMLFLGTNKTGVDIPDGTIITITGAQGSRPTIAPAESDDFVCGVTTEAIANNLSGYITEYGLVRDIDTSAWVAGTRLYLDAITPGAFTDTAPAAPIDAWCVAIVLFSNATEGVILVAPKAIKTYTELDARYVEVSGDTMTGTLETLGVRQAATSKAADYTLAATDEVVVFTADATATLPAATGTGQTYRIIVRDGATVIIDPDGADTIAGDGDFTIYDGEDLILTDAAAGKWE